MDGMGYPTLRQTHRKNNISSVDISFWEPEPWIWNKHHESSDVYLTPPKKMWNIWQIQEARFRIPCSTCRKLKCCYIHHDTSDCAICTSNLRPATWTPGATKPASATGATNPWGITQSSSYTGKRFVWK